MSNNSYTPLVHAKLVEALRAGAFRQTACARAGIHRRTMYNWLQRGRRGEEPYATLLADIEHAEAEQEDELKNEIIDIGKGRKKHEVTCSNCGSVAELSKPDWKALAWFMEKRWHRRYGARLNINVENAKEQLIEAVHRVLEQTPGGAAIFNKVLDELEQTDPEVEGGKTVRGLLNAGPPRIPPPSDPGV